jgi:hypothetical protein
MNNSASRCRLVRLGISKRLKNVGEAVSARQKQAKKRSLRVVNEHFEPAFNAAMATQVVFQQRVRVAPPVPTLTPGNAMGETGCNQHGG